MTNEKRPMQPDAGSTFFQSLIDDAFEECNESNAEESFVINLESVVKKKPENFFMKEIEYIELTESLEGAQQRVELVPNKINVITGPGGILRLPKPSETCFWLKLIFMDQSKVCIEGNGKKIRLGPNEAFFVITEPGQGPFDSQPEFVWIEKRDTWVCMTQGALKFPTGKKEEPKQIEKQEKPIEDHLVKNESGV